ncbi:phosphatase PAP2 family protein [Clostridium oryzae]|uniref:PAP2 superfamily protein n=1 Tax=Clostridium oryzae TaxID=1450648 RepID=A0A1V4IQX3_9CLOT|nr:phosphatase PAP2 family protein [Clostridium oryzae]OPJ62412.1 PAP2 superfamily protein [Clostridium oryzae]
MVNINNEIYYKYKHFSMLLLYGITGMLFGLCEKHIKYTKLVYSSLDSYIPFVKEAVVPYITWYIYIAVAILFLGLYSVVDYYKLVTFLTLGMLVGITAFILYPTRQNLRPVIASNDIFSSMIKTIYSLDTPTNVTPSLHVMLSIGVFCSLENCQLLKSKKVIRVISLITMLLICASTVLIKQHSIIDVFWGVIAGIGLYILIYKAKPDIWSVLVTNGTDAKDKITMHENDL